jgi:hypothetical protein
MKADRLRKLGAPVSSICAFALPIMAGAPTVGNTPSRIDVYSGVKAGEPADRLVHAAG